MYGSLDISLSGMVAQRTRLQAISANIANKDAYLDAKGTVNPYRRRHVLMTPGDPSAKTADGRRMGVHVAAIQIDQRAVRWQHDPSNPLAEKTGEHAGYVLVPDISLVTEQINKLEAERAYEANLAAAEATKSMMAQALRLIA